MKSDFTFTSSSNSLLRSGPDWTSCHAYYDWLRLTSSRWRFLPLSLPLFDLDSLCSGGMRTNMHSPASWTKFQYQDGLVQKQLTNTLLFVIFLLWLSHCAWFSVRIISRSNWRSNDMSERHALSSSIMTFKSLIWALASQKLLLVLYS